MQKKKIYLFMILGCLAGYVWLYWGISHPVMQHSDTTGICIMKHVTGMPCPSCGSTRSVICILQGDFFKALHWNPLGFFLLLLLFTLPFWIFYDYITGSDSLLRCYTKAEIILRQKKIALPAFALILLNWYWNIQKGL